MWTKQQDQQLVYFLERGHGLAGTPRRSCWASTLREEFDSPRDTFAGTTINAEPLTTGQVIGDTIPEHTAPPKRTVRELVRDKLVGVETAEQVHAVADLPAVKRALIEAPDSIKDEIGAMLTAALERVQAVADSELSGEDA